VPKKSTQFQDVKISSADKSSLALKQMQMSMANGRMIPKGIRGIIYSYLTLEELVKKISAVSKGELEFI